MRARLTDHLVGHIPVQLDRGDLVVHPLPDVGKDAEPAAKQLVHVGSHHPLIH